MLSFQVLGHWSKVLHREPDSGPLEQQSSRIFGGPQSPLRIVVKTVGVEEDRSGFKFQLCHLLVVHTWVVMNTSVLMKLG